MIIVTRVEGGSGRESADSLNISNISNISSVSTDQSDRVLSSLSSSITESNINSEMPLFSSNQPTSLHESRNAHDRKRRASKRDHHMSQLIDYLVESKRSRDETASVFIETMKAIQNSFNSRNDNHVMEKLERVENALLEITNTLSQLIPKE